MKRKKNTLFEKVKKIFSKKTTHLKKTSKVENLEKKFKNLSGEPRMPTVPREKNP